MNYSFHSLSSSAAVVELTCISFQWELQQVEIKSK
jgi:hypothetical protein